MHHKHLTRPAISEAKQASQFKLACNALHTVLCALFGSGKPADRVMSAFFRNNPRCGARDRRLISEIVYAVLRNCNTCNTCNTRVCVKMCCSLRARV